VFVSRRRHADFVHSLFSVLTKALAWQIPGR
jgi:hypothetical protein